MPLKQKLQPFWSSNFRKLFIFAPLLCTLLIQAMVSQHIFCLTSKFCIPIVFVNTMNQFFHFSIYWLLEMVFSFVFFYFFPTFAYKQWQNIPKQKRNNGNSYLYDVSCSWPRRIWSEWGLSWTQKTVCECCHRFELRDPPSFATVSLLAGRSELG